MNNCVAQSRVCKQWSSYINVINENKSQDIDIGFWS